MIAATFHGPNYEASVNDESTIEVFHSLGHAMSALFDRYDSNGARSLEVHYLNGFIDSTFFPCVTEGHYLQCYLVNEPDEDMQDEGVILNVLTAVHMGAWDYTLTLVPPFGDRVNSSDTIGISVTRGA